MKTKNIFIGFMALTLFVLPAITQASTYHFVDTSGNLQSMQADNSNNALNTAPRLGVYSGVMLMNHNSTTSTPFVFNSINTSGSGNYYYFVDTSGNLQGLWATSFTDALNRAHQLGAHSGVMFAS